MKPDTLRIGFRASIASTVKVVKTYTRSFPDEP